jgi:hypothetical protein
MFLFLRNIVWPSVKQPAGRRDVGVSNVSFHVFSC